MEYANKLRTLMIYRCYVPFFLALSNEDAGILFKALLADFTNRKRQPIEDERLQGVYDIIVKMIEDSAKKFLETEKSL